MSAVLPGMLRRRGQLGADALPPHPTDLDVVLPAEVPRGRSDPAVDQDELEPLGDACWVMCSNIRALAP